MFVHATLPMSCFRGAQDREGAWLGTAQMGSDPEAFLHTCSHSPVPVTHWPTPSVVLVAKWHGFDLDTKLSQCWWFTSVELPAVWDMVHPLAVA